MREAETRRRIGGLAAAICCAYALLAASPPAGAVTLQPGDILIADPTADAIILVDPATGQQTAVSNSVISGPDLFQYPLDLITDSTGRLLVADGDSQGGAVIRVDPATGQQSFVSNNAINTGTDHFDEPTGIGLDRSGRILVADRFSGANGALIRVDPASGQQTAVSNDAINTGTDLFCNPADVTADRTGRLLVADPCTTPDGAVIGVDPATGQQTAVSDNTINTGTDLFSNVFGIVLDRSGSILVSDYSSQGVDSDGAVIRVDPVTGQQSFVSNNLINTGTDLFDEPYRLALTSAGKIVVVDRFAAGGSVIQVDPATGQQTLVSNNSLPGPDLLTNPWGIEVVPGRCRGVSATITGTAAADTLTGTPARDVVDALAGNDLVKGLAGNDLLCGGKGRDRLLGGKGKDKLFGGAGRDRLRGGPGRDVLRGGPGRDRQRQ